MGLITQNGYVRIDFSSGYSEETMNIAWKVYPSKTNWGESNPQSMLPGIMYAGQTSVSLAIKEMQDTDELDENNNPIQQEVVIGYEPQTIDVAHQKLMNLNMVDARFADYEWEIDI